MLLVTSLVVTRQPQFRMWRGLSLWSTFAHYDSSAYMYDLLGLLLLAYTSPSYDRPALHSKNLLAGSIHMV